MTDSASKNTGLIKRTSVILATLSLALIIPSAVAYASEADTVPEETEITIDENNAASGNLDENGVAADENNSDSDSLDVSDQLSEPEDNTDSATEGTDDVNTDNEETENDVIESGFVEENGNVYYVCENGEYAKGFITLNDTDTYYFDSESGILQKGQLTVDGESYLADDETGLIYKGWYENDSIKCFFSDEDGHMFKGWQTIGKYKYYFDDENGSMFIGWHTMDDCKYYFCKSNGHMLKGWHTLGNYKYYFNKDNGRMFTGWHTIGDYKYYFCKSNGHMLKGWHTLGGYKYYFCKSNGHMLRGWHTLGDYKYYFAKSNGHMLKGWHTLGGYKYYFNTDNGRTIISAFKKIDGEKYYFGKTGKLKTDGWFTVDKACYYANSKGVLARDKVVEGYKLDSAGKSKTKYRIDKYVKDHTNSKMTDQEKIKALYDWVLKNDMDYIRTYEHARPDWEWKDSWVDDMASSLMDNWGGNCFRYASLMGMLIREATGLQVRVYHGSTPGSSTGLTPHGWVTVKQSGTWYSYDVELNKFCSAYGKSSCYKVPYSQSKGNLYFKGVATNLY